MLFNSYVFMLAFLPLTLLGYFLLGRLPEKIQLNKVFLVLASFLFYGYNNPSYVPIIAGSMEMAISPLVGSIRESARGMGLSRGRTFLLTLNDDDCVFCCGVADADAPKLATCGCVTVAWKDTVHSP